MPEADLQKMWDRLLLSVFIRDFYSDKYRQSMGSLVFCFESMTGHKIGEIKRGPVNSHQCNQMNVVRFVCAHLPRLATILIDKEKTMDDVDDLVDKLQRWSINTVAEDRKMVNEARRRRYDTDVYRASRRGVAIRAETNNLIDQFNSAHRLKSARMR